MTQSQYLGLLTTTWLSPVPTSSGWNINLIAGVACGVVGLVVFTLELMEHNK